MSPNTFFLGKININLSKAPEERDLIQLVKNKGSSALNRNAVTDYEIPFPTARTDHHG
jgi:hypothetical protein